MRLAEIKQENVSLANQDVFWFDIFVPNDGRDGAMRWLECVTIMEDYYGEADSHVGNWVVSAAKRWLLGATQRY